MRIEQNIAFIGAGNMAGAILRGLLHAEACEPRQIYATDLSQGRLDELRAEHGIEIGRSNGPAVAWADVVVLATKPQVFDRVLPEVAAAIRPGTLLVSIAAGVPTTAIEAHMPEGVRVVRTMPNTPALVDAGATAISPGREAHAEDLDLVQRIFDNVGVTVIVEESLLDAVTGLSGSGPAYIFLVIEALADAGVKVGLHREVALKLAAQTVLGSAKLLIETGEHPGRLKDRVTSPGGTAIAGLHTLEEGGLRTTLINAVESATQRARELGIEATRKLSGGS
ncbi:MAG: pyrroline-5-carboxylate reductase [Myxococcales bacterium]|nr:pyrroline-5-carboxylate reductase [Myxococcales bacterium]